MIPPKVWYKDWLRIGLFAVVNPAIGTERGPSRRGGPCDVSSLSAVTSPIRRRPLGSPLSLLFFSGYLTRVISLTGTSVSASPGNWPVSGCSCRIMSKDWGRVRMHIFYLFALVVSFFGRGIN